MLDILKSGAKTAAAYLTALLLGWLTTIGIDVPPDALEATLTALFVGAVAALGNWVLKLLSVKFPALLKWIPGYQA